MDQGHGVGCDAGLQERGHAGQHGVRPLLATGDEEASVRQAVRQPVAKAGHALLGDNQRHQSHPRQGGEGVD